VWIVDLIVRSCSEVTEFFVMDQWVFWAAFLEAFQSAKLLCTIVQ